MTREEQHSVLIDWLNKHPSEEWTVDGYDGDNAFTYAASSGDGNHTEIIILKYDNSICKCNKTTWMCGPELIDPICDNYQMDEEFKIHGSLDICKNCYHDRACHVIDIPEESEQPNDGADATINKQRGK
jgi:hypothetical protein